METRYETLRRESVARGVDLSIVGLQPEDVRDDVFRWLEGRDVIEHSNDEKEWDHLCGTAFALEIKNPVAGGVSVFLEFDGDFTAFFGACHCHYSSYISDYELMKQDVEDFLSSRTCAVSLWSKDGEWLSSDGSDEDLTADCADDIVRRHSACLPKEFRDKLPGGTVKVQYFDTARSFTAPIPYLARSV